MPDGRLPKPSEDRRPGSLPMIGLLLEPSIAISVFPNADQDAQNIDAIAEDRLHRLVGRLEADAVLVAEELLERGLALFVADRDDLAVARLLLLA